MSSCSSKPKDIFETDDEHDVYGPVIPLALRQANEGVDYVSDKQEVLGPPLPPGFKQDDSDDDETYGPSLPPGFKSTEAEEDDSFGPPLPPGHQRQEVSSEEEGEIIGPFPPSVADLSNTRTVAEQFEERAKRMKDKLDGKDKESAPERESWMTELPDNNKSFGLGPRSFRKNALPENKDRSSWTDSPAEQERKLREKLIAKAKGKTSNKKAEPQISERDKRIAEQVDAFNSCQRDQSLLNMHADTRKRKSEEGDGTQTERRPFDRDIDLQVNRFDDAQRKNLIKKSAKLDTRFSHGKEKMFL